MRDATFWNGRWWRLRECYIDDQAMYGGPFCDDSQRSYGKPFITAHSSSSSATPMDPNGWRFSHPYYNDFSVTSEVWMERVSSALAGSRQGSRRATATFDCVLQARLGHSERRSTPMMNSVQSARDDIREIEGEQDDHLDKFKSRTRYHQEVEDGISVRYAEELETRQRQGRSRR